MSGKRQLIEHYGNRTIELVDDRHLTHNSDTGFKGIARVMKEDCEPYFEQAKKLSLENPGKDFRHAGIVPHFQYAEWLVKARQEGLGKIPQKWIRDWANDSENQKFRTWPGKL